MFLAQYAKPDLWKLSTETRQVLISVKVDVIAINQKEVFSHVEGRQNM